MYNNNVQNVFSLKQALLATLAYFDILDFPLTLAEIQQYLYGWSVPKEAIEEIIRDVSGISHSHGYYFWRGRQEIAELRKERQKIAEKLWKRVERWNWFLALCPFVRMVAVCNSLSYGNVNEKSDIDLFVVTENNRLATARFFMKLFTHLAGIRVHHDKIAGRFCLSFFVTEKAMNLEPLAYDFDPHLAYFVKMIKPIFGLSMYQSFIAGNNEWTEKYFKRPLAPKTLWVREFFFSRMVQWCLEFFAKMAGEKLEQKCSEWLAKREWPYREKFLHSQSIVINKNVFKFHEKDTREEIGEEFQIRMMKL